VTEHSLSDPPCRTDPRSPAAPAISGSRSLLAARAFFRDPVGYSAREGSDASLVALGAVPGPFVLARDAQAVWQVLVAQADYFRQGKWKRRARRFLGATLNTLDGEEHRRRRRLLRASLDRRRIAAFTDAMVARAERAQSGWEDGAVLRVRDELDPLSLAMAGDVLLSTDLEPHAAELAEALSIVMGAVPRLRPPLFGTRAARALARIDRLLAALVAGRRQSGRRGEDLLDVLLTSGLPDGVIRGELTAFLLAAVDEPPSALEAALYLLARHPHTQACLHQELNEALRGRGLTSAYEARLPYLDAVVRETLRLFPPARHIDRCPATEVTIAGARVPAGANVVVSPLVTHRDPRLYESPSAFWPERWLTGGQGDRRGAYLPFGAGAHACIGQPLARAIVGLTLATIARRWRVQAGPGAPPPGPRAPRLVVRLERR
jgi:cytochrome P450